MSQLKEFTTMPLVDGKTKISLRNILYATDFSQASERALDYALAVARRYESRILVTHVIAPDAYQLVPPESVATTLELIRRRAEQEMGDLLVSGRLRGVPHQVLVTEGQIWSVLSDVVRNNEIDLIVLGTHGRTGVHKIFLGSVAEQIFRLADCPVMTVGPKTRGDSQKEAELQHILYATDFSPTSERAAGYALSLAQEHQAHLTLLHVVRDVADVSERSAEVLRDFFVRRLQKILPPETDLWCEPEFAVAFGNPAEEILSAAAARRADLIVLGVRGGGNFISHLPPATAYNIVCQAPCPVLTVRG